MNIFEGDRGKRSNHDIFRIKKLVNIVKKARKY